MTRCEFPVTTAQLPRPARQIQQKAHSLLAEGKPTEAVDLAVEAVARLVDEVSDLRKLLTQLRNGRGNKSERMDPAQLELLLNELEAAAASAETDLAAELEEDRALDAEIERAEAANPTPAPARRTRNAGIRMEDLPVVQTEVPVPEDKQHWERIGVDVIRRLRFQAAQFYCEVLQVPVLRAPELSEDGETVIEKLRDLVPPTLKSGCLAGPDVIAHIINAKYGLHLPLHRQRRNALQTQGLDLPVSTLSDWVAMGGEACQRLEAPLRDKVLNSWLVQTDATGLRVLDRGPENIHRGTIWAYIGRSEDPKAPPNIWFHYTPTGEGAPGPWKILKGRTGYIQADALNTHDRLYNGKAASGIEVGCLAHGRRKFRELLPDETRAAYVIQQFKRIYRLETLAETQGLSREAWTELRQTRTRPIMEDKLRPYLERLQTTTVPSQPLHKAARYMLNHWTALTRFLDDSALPLDNNAVESALRPIRLGEHNHLFIGSDAAAERVAAILSLLATCRAHGHNPQDYLTAAFTRLASPASDAQLLDLLPDAWRPS